MTIALHHVHAARRRRFPPSALAGVAASAGTAVFTLGGLARPVEMRWKLTG